MAPMCVGCGREFGHVDDMVDGDEDLVVWHDGVFCTVCRPMPKGVRDRGGWGDWWSPLPSYWR